MTARCANLPTADERAGPPRPSKDPVAKMSTLRAVAARLERSADPAEVELAAAIKAYDVAAGMITMDEALGLSRCSGAGPWWRVEARARRDAKLRELHQEHFRDLELGEAAAEIVRQARRRQTTGAPATNERDAMIDLALRAGPVPKARRLREILCNPPPTTKCTDRIARE